MNTHNPSFSSTSNHKLEAEARKSSSHFQPPHQSGDNIPHPHASEHHDHTSNIPTDLDEKTTSANRASNRQTSHTSSQSSTIKHDDDILSSNAHKQAPLRQQSQQIERHAKQFVQHAEESSHELANSALNINEVMTNLVLGQINTATQAFINLSLCRNPVNFFTIQQEWVQNSLHNVSIAAERITTLVNHASNSNINHAEELAGTSTRRTARVK